MTIEDMDAKKKGLWQMIAGGVAVVLSLVGFLWQRHLKGRGRIVVIAASALLLLSGGYLFFTGWQNYAVVMFGHSPLPAGAEVGSPTLTTDIVKAKTPVIKIGSKQELKNLLAAKGKTFLWLPCSKGGDWYKLSARLYTRWTLPGSDVACPDGRKLIDYGP